jgi:starvation-inducible DNA-binding protein
MLKALHADNETLIGALKDAKALADQAGDNATDGLLDNWTDQAEQRAWFLAATIGEA